MHLGEISGHHAPHPGGVNPVIGVSDDITQPTHLPPWKMLVAGFDLVGQVRRGLTNNLQSALNRIPKLAIVSKFCERTVRCKISDISHRFINIGQILRLATRHGKRQGMVEGAVIGRAC